MAERLFFAVPITDALRERLLELQEISLETLLEYGIVNVRPENLRNSHITVRFLGDVENAQTLIQALDVHGLTINPFQFSLNEIGVFDDPRRARVLWAGVDRLDNFRELRRQLDEILIELGWPEEKKGYRPHLTLARFRVPSDIRPCFAELQQLTDVCSIDRFAVEEVVLYSSKLSPHGATHTKRALLKLN